MDLEKLQLYEKLGNSHWWLTSKYTILKDFLIHHAPSRTDFNPMLDIGCGGGVFLKKISDIAPFQFGADLNYKILLNRQTQNNLFVTSNAKQLPYKDNVFSLVSAIDILEHIDDDNIAVHEIFRVLKSNGWVLVSVPAYMSLFGDHDKLFGHIRRYKLNQIRNILISNGFLIKKATYIQPLFFLPLFLKRRFFPTNDNYLGDFNLPPKTINNILHHILAFERFPLRLINFPFGPTILVLAQKK